MTPTFALLALLLTATPLAYAQPQISQAELHYPISGNTPDDLRAQINGSGPAVQGQHYDASTEYFVRWDIEYQTNDAGCKIAKAAIALNITQHMPEWQNYAAATPDMKQVWDSYYNKLKQHEAGHVNHGVESANEVEAMMTSLPEMQTCAMLEVAAKEKTDAITNKYKAMDIEYDSATSHGENQHFS